jgi:hypothetical protein
MNTNSFIPTQDQVSSPYWPYSLDEYLDDETILISEGTPPMIPDYIKAQLQRLVTRLGLDISILIQDVGYVREIFNQIKNDLPSSLKEMIQPAAFLEGSGPKFFSPQSRLVAREAQKNSAATEGNASKTSYQSRKQFIFLKNPLLRSIEN